MVGKLFPGRLLRALCVARTREAVGNYDHVTACLGMRHLPPPADFSIDFLVDLAERANTVNPGSPAHCPQEVKVDLELLSALPNDEIGF